MAAPPAPDAALAPLLTPPHPTTIPAVLARMDALDAALAPTDGLRWFNRLYRTVTDAVNTSLATSAWHNPEWLEKLDILFAGYYFNALRAWTESRPESRTESPTEALTEAWTEASTTQPNPAPSLPASWQAFFAARFAPGIDRIQFAVAGMNAHINHDLALALLDTDAALGLTPATGSPEWQDYQAINQILNAVMPQALAMLAADPLGVLAQDTGRIGRLLAFWNICSARDLAWDFAAHLRPLTGLPRAAALAVQDRMTGALGRAILLQP